MDRKKEWKRQFKETTVDAGVYLIKNIKNQKILVGKSRNLKTLNGVKFMLENGTYTINKALQAEWNEFGKEAFVFDVLEKLKKKEDPYFNEKEALLKLEQKWLEQLQPFEERGYNQK
ncbi:GIY-YIG nuclease family protein [Shimazuella alba]|uniref:GIY-YIG nuclease family protein n=1 Tax=Shimazuella alba TaxID=2690964 RepID=A0A6I4W408_9BACL|nr:GIY-YIG nuclease family protein [Shimazuella alba]MXQ55042.1 GIY-YIG nuclease family protein [Shimazuella alba]